MTPLVYASHTFITATRWFFLTLFYHFMPFAGTEIISRLWFNFDRGKKRVSIEGRRRCDAADVMHVGRVHASRMQCPTEEGCATASCIF